MDSLTVLESDAMKVLIIEAVTKIVLAFIATLPILAATIYSAWRSFKNSEKLDHVHDDFNSKMDIALIDQKALGHGEGVAQERIEERERQHNEKRR